MADTGVVKQYKQLAGSLTSLPFGRSQSFDITAYVVAKTMDGLFYICLVWKICGCRRSLGDNGRPGNLIGKPQ
jgi:hypothetical protein